MNPLPYLADNECAHGRLPTDQNTPPCGCWPAQIVDPVNHPSHYNKGKIEVITAIDDWNLGFCLGNVVKYIARAPHKGNSVEDLKKAAWYLNHEIERLSSGKS